MKNINHKGILVYIEQRGNEIQKVALELLGIGKTLSKQLNTHLSAVIIGSQMSKLAKELVYYDADFVHVVDDPILDYYVNEPYTKALTQVILETNPEIVLIGATTLGRDLAPRVSARIKTGLTADCTKLEIEANSRKLIMTRPAFGGNLMAEIICPDHFPQMASVRPGVMIQPKRNENLKGKVLNTNIAFDKKDMNVEVLEFIKQKTKKIRIEDANVLISVGRGIDSKEKMNVVYELADKLKGEVSGTRAVIDNEWLDKDRQVGQTGKTVRPDLYLACGISGAIQHISGMEESGLIIAINKNPKAAIFEVSDLGVVGDVSKVLPLVVKELNNMDCPIK